MPNKVQITVGGDASAAEAEFKKIQSAFKDMADKVKERTRAIGIAFTVMGGAITGVAGLAIKSSLEQEVGINRLDQALKNVGTSYRAQVKDVEAVISAQQAKTNFSDEQQRDALQKLVTIGGQWQGSLQALKITTDVAAGANIDLNAAALLVGKAIAGETSSLSRYGILLEKGATQTEIMAALTTQFGGAAEAAANPMIQLKNRLDDMLQVMGNALLPIMSKAAQVIGDIALRIQEWAEEHPQLAKWLSIVAAALGGVMLVVGPLLIALPALITGIGALGAVIAVATGPIGLITLAVAGLVTGAILLWRNWETVWNGVKSITEKAVNAVIGLLNKVLDGMALYLTAIKKVLDAIPGGNPLGKFMQQGIDALQRGIPTIDLTAEKVEVMGQTFDDMAQQAAISLDQAGTSVETFAGRSRRAAEEVLSPWEAMLKKREQLFIDEIQAVAEATEKGRQNDFVRASDAEKRREELLQRGIAVRRDILSKSMQDEFDAIGKGWQVTAELEFKAQQKRLADLAAFNKDKLAFEEKVAQNIAAMTARAASDNEQIASRNADAIKRIQDGIARSWDSLRDRLDPFLSKLREFGVGAEQVIQAWADKVGTSASNIIDFLIRSGVAHDDLRTIVQRAAQAMGVSYDELIAKIGALEGATRRANLSLEEQRRLAGMSTPEDITRRSSAEETRLRGDLLNIQAQIGRYIEAGLTVPDTLRLALSQSAERLNKLRAGELPDFAHGGTVPGPRGAPMPIMAHGGETVIPIGRSTSSLVFNFTINGDVTAEDLVQKIQRTVRDTLNAGGFPQLVRA